MPDLIDCNGIHPGETISSSDLPELSELIPGFNPMNPPICSRPGRLVGDREHLDTGKHPLLTLMDENKTKGKDSPIRKIIEDVFRQAGNGADAAITLYPVDTESYPALQVKATWRDKDTGEPSDQKVGRLRTTGQKAYDEATDKISLADLGLIENRRLGMRASILAIYKEIS